MADMNRRAGNDDRGRDSGRERGRDDRGGRDSRDDRGSYDIGREERGGRDAGRDTGRSTGRGSSGFSYQRRDPTEAKKRAERSSKDWDVYLRDDVKMFKPRDGDNTIRILPATWEGPRDHYGIDIYVHYSIGPDEQTYLCLEKHGKGDCPICTERVRAKKDHESEDYIKDLEPTRRSLFWMIDRDDERAGVQAWPSPATFDQNVVKVSIDRRTGDVLPIDDPEQGFDIEFNKTGKGIGTKYNGIAIARRDSPLGKAEWLDYAIENPLPSILEFQTAEHIEKTLGGGGAHTTRSDRDSRDAGGGDREQGRGRDDRGSDLDTRDSGRDRGRDDRGGDRGRRDEPEITWEVVHAMTTTELDALCESRPDLKHINPNKADTDEILADWICEDLKLRPTEDRGRGREPEGREPERGRGDPPADGGDRLSRMREQRR